MMTTPPRLLALQTGVPDHCYEQDDITNFYLQILGATGARRERAIRAVMNHAGVQSRYSAVEAAYFDTAKSTKERNDRYMQEAVVLGERVIRAGLENAGIEANAITSFVVVSCTGFNVPGLDLILAGKLGMNPQLSRTCVFGMGCYGAFPGLKRAMDSVKAQPDGLALVLALELCTLHLQFDESVESVVSTSLFADGAAMALVGSGETRFTPHPPTPSPTQAGRGGEISHRASAAATQSAWTQDIAGRGGASQPADEVNMSTPSSTTGIRLIDTETYCDYQTLDQMSFTVTDQGFRMYLSSYVPDVLAANVGGFVERLLSRNSLKREDVKFWAIHPGSKKIVEYIQQELCLSDQQVRASLDTLRDYGNMSSATVLFVLERIAQTESPKAGDFGVMMAFGPGLTMESMLVQW